MINLLYYFLINIFFAGLLFPFQSFAATPIDLSKKTFTNNALALDRNMVLLSSETNNEKTHQRYQQLYQGYPIWGADFILHSQNNVRTGDGIYYQNLQKDLGAVPSHLLVIDNQTQLKNQILLQAREDFKLSAIPKFVDSKPMVYIDEKNKAHWAIKITAYHADNKSVPVKANYIVDVNTHEIYKHWNDIKTESLEEVSGGGFGGNPKIGKINYDNIKGHYTSLNLQRDAKHNCYLQNDFSEVKDYRKLANAVSFKCQKLDKKHNNLYWDGSFDQTNGAYSPSNDALYDAYVIKKMYLDWYQLPVLTENDKPMKLSMIVHADMENAYWDGKTMTFGDGGSMFYPLVSLDVGAHEISHGFTEQHSNLVYDAQSGGLNESFSDMASQAAQFYSAKKNDWKIGADIMKAKNEALRYMDKPSKDCGRGQTPGTDCSIDHVSQYSSQTDVHYSSGIFNKVFYLMGTAKGWDAHKAFDVMVQANRFYWTSTANFQQAACGVLKATDDLHYEKSDVLKALQAVGLDDKC